MKTSFARDMVARTQEGTEALLRAAGPAFTGRDHFTLGALAVGETAVWSRLFKWRTLGVATTAAVPVLLALRPDCAPETRVGLIAASLGQAAKRGAPTTFGVTCVSAQYASFAWALRGARNDAVGLGPARRRVGRGPCAFARPRRAFRHGYRRNPGGCALRASR